ncbi:tRNA (N6-isopentenyl adenosine(37)-C2)-methylthiotransferase MiaB [candidate division TA06 bacterium]|uniref:tRNA-2-methylthio-N(6)-dimethylallyladenosine synthase n=1 Tax=candidate division TA06 bacterium TaxID=2250710 RepID=A0A523USS7_UNCT6|nr:MAG: tRNA (N6-isopentenyl adenosine(37)-C2)-methylthiotransferase MiaB [candidate division TA06 bacterium]
MPSREFKKSYEKSALRFYIKTYGCQMNKHDSSIVKGLLAKDGYEETNNPEDADLILLNTCSVRRHAEARAIGRANNLTNLKAKNPDLVIGIIGCLAQSKGAKVIQDAPCVDLVVGPDCYRDLPELIRSYTKSRRSVVLTEVRQSETYGDLNARPDAISAFIPIMRGCNNFCSYCIVPYTRGRERSRPAREIVGEVRELTRNDVKEITLIGQNVNSYNDGEHGFADLLRIVDSAVGDARIRFTTSHPRDLGDEVVSAIVECESVCEHIHLPLQSGSSRVLTLMNRGYTVEEYMEKVDTARRLVKGVALTTDLLVGFPGETDSDFKQTLDVVREIAFDFAYMFAYSTRKKTRAATMEGQVPREVRQERLKELIGIQNKITEERNRSLVSETVEVLVWGKSKNNPRENVGKSRTNKDIVFRGEAKAGDYVNVKVEELRGWTAYGRIVG